MKLVGWTLFYEDGEVAFGGFKTKREIVYYIIENCLFLSSISDDDLLWKDKKTGEIYKIKCLNGNEKVKATIITINNNQLCKFKEEIL